MSRPIVVLKLGNTFPTLAAARGDFEHWVLAGMGVEIDDGTAIVVTPASGDPLPPPKTIAGAVVTGSHAMVTDGRPWSRQAGAWLVGLIEQCVPVLGICYGHQLLAHSLGGRVTDNPRGRSFGVGTVRLTDHAQDDALLSGMPTEFPAFLSHTQSVVELPDRARLLAVGARDPHHAFVVGDRAWGVQFHPEFDGPIARHYVGEMADELRREGQDPDALGAECSVHSPAVSLLRRFRELARLA